MESIFCLMQVVEPFSLQKVAKMLEWVVAGWQEVRWIWLIRQNSIAQFIQLLKCWLCDMQLGTVMEKNWVLSVDQCWLQVLQFSGQLTEMLSILLRYNSFAGIQKAVVDQISSRPPNSDHDLFLVHVLALGSALELLLNSITELVTAGCCRKFTLCCASQSNRETVRCCVQ